jgi:hypothetical protein
MGAAGRMGAVGAGDEREGYSTGELIGGGIDGAAVESYDDRILEVRASKRILSSNSVGVMKSGSSRIGESLSR